MNNVFHTIAKIEVSNYLRDYRDADRFIEYCKKCNEYNRCWSCPPFDFDQESYLSHFDKAYIIGTKIVIEKEIIEKNRGWDKCTATSYGIIDKVRLDLDRKLLEMEGKYPESRVFFAGSCRICVAEGCMRSKGKQCIHPNKIRPSLEAFGFDMDRTSSELLNIEMKWSLNGTLPDYFTLVSGLFVKTANIDQSDLLSHLESVSIKLNDFSKDECRGV